MAPDRETPAATEATGFAGWPIEALTFFDALEDNNTREWFLANKASYELFVRAPTERFLASAEREFGPSHLFRPNRDVRFAKDKAPYKTNIGAVIGPRPGAGTTSGIFYVHLDQSGLTAASGYYMMAPDQVARFRAAVADDVTGTQLDAIVAVTAKAKLSTGTGDLKRVPPPYPRDHPRAELLTHKSLTVSRTFGQPGWLHTAKARDHVIGVWRAAADLIAWLDRNVGPSEQPSRWS